MRLPLHMACCLCVASGCAENSPGPPPPPVMTVSSAEDLAHDAAAEQSSGALVSSERRPFDGLEFLIPEGWTEIPLSDFQKGIVSAKFSMPEAGPDVTLTLSRSGGGLEANLDRWRGQVSQSRPEITEPIAVAGVDATWIDLEGRFSGGFGKEPQSDWRMLGVIVPLADQGYFMKLTGPVDEVAAVEKDFRAFAKSATKE